MTTTHENNELAHSKQVSAQPMDSEQANPKSDHSEMIQAEQMDTEPMDTEVADSQPVEEPVNSKAVNEPADSQTMNEHVDPQVVNEPTGSQVVDEPVDSEAVSKSADTQAVNKSADTQAVNESADTQAVNESADTQAVNESADTQAVNESADTQAANESADTQVVNEPAGSQTVTEPADSQAVNEAVDSQAVNEHVDPQVAVSEHVDPQVAVNEMVDSQAVNKHVDSQTINEHVNSQAMDEHVDSPAMNKHVDSQTVNEPIDSHFANEPVDSQGVCNSQAINRPIDSQAIHEPMDTEHMGDDLGHPQPLSEEDIYSHPMSSEHMHSESMHSLPMSMELAHSQPIHAEMVHSHHANNAGEPMYSQSINSELVHTHPVTAELVPSQSVSSELAHFGHVNLEPVNLQPVGMELPNTHSHETELVNSHMELANTTQPLSTDISDAQLTTPETQPNKRRKKKSIVWEHFTIETVGAGCRRACCKVCKQSFAYSTGSKVAGTSHLKRHIAKGTCPVILRQQDKNQLSPYMPRSGGTEVTADPPKRRYRSSSSPYLIFDQDRCRHEIARMIIMHDYPLHMVEHPGFVSFVQNLQPRFDMVSFNIVQGDCVATFLREKQNLQRFIEGIPGRICLTLDMWTSSQSTGYVFVTGQFIDNDWKLHRKLLNVVMEPFPESDSALSHAIGTCLSDWGVDRKLASITFNQVLGETALDNLRALLAVKNPMLLNGQLLIRNCLARTLSSMAQDVFAGGHQTVKKIRASVKYVKTSESHEEKFLELKQQLQVPTEKTLLLDNTTKWNTTYEMLLAASELKEVFSCLDTSDPEYRDSPSMEDWKQVEHICMYLKLLYDTANLLTAKGTPSPNVFFHEVWKIQLELARAAASDDLFVSGLARILQDKFLRYWKNTCLVLAIAVAMDPRFKMKLVEFSFTKIFGEEAPVYIRVVDDGIHELFHEYVTLPLPLTPAYTEDGNPGNVKTEGQQEGSILNSNGLSDFDMYIMETTSQQMKSELDQYLEESLLPRVQDFNVLGWWKLNKLKYPTLSKMARDILSFPLSTVPSDAVFDTAAKEMDAYRCSLRPETVEALICAKDWLQQDSSNDSKEVVKMEL